MMIGIFLILSVFLNVILLFAILNITKKIEVYEDFITVMRDDVTNVITQMRAVDIRGSFEADDEVGIVFKGMLGLVASLTGFLNQGE
jgi:hypothetical protein